MKQVSYTDEDKARALDEFRTNVSTLNTAITEQIKESVMDAFQDTVQTAKIKAKQALSQIKPEEIIRSHPRITLGAAFAIGALLGAGRLTMLRPLFITGVSLAIEQWQKMQKTGPTSDHFMSERAEILH